MPNEIVKQALLDAYDRYLTECWDGYTTNFTADVRATELAKAARAYGDEGVIEAAKAEAPNISGSRPQFIEWFFGRL